MRIVHSCLLVIIVNSICFAQQTVGIFLNTPSSFDGYTLLAPLSDSTTYLLDNCGRIVHTWSSNYKPGLSVYLQPDGTLIRPTSIKPDSKFGNQAGGRVEKVDWDGNILWEYTYSTSQYHQHHDIAPMPDGNVLLMAFEYKSPAEIIAGGRDTAIAGNGLWPEHIVEVKPIGADSGTIVWEWHSWDHYVQQFDAAKPNYALVADHPELLNLNYRPVKGNVSQIDWMHGNSIAYNEELDQIVLSSRSFSELMIIDHNTSTAEAASHSGGNRGRGGDILYRWGNPEAYGRGTPADQKLFFQHNVHWIPKGLKGEGHLQIFNNGFDRSGGNYSSIDEIITPVDSNGNYPVLFTGTYDPIAPYWSYKSNPVDSFYSPFISGMQRLPNGNTLICEGIPGRLFEVDSTGTLVWDYISPVNQQGRISQGIVPVNNLVFRALRYARDYPAFTGKTLIPAGYVELNPLNYNCTIYPDSQTTDISNMQTKDFINIYPNPSSEKIYISLSSALDFTVAITDIFGRDIKVIELHGSDNEINICDITPGIYLCSIRDQKGQILKTARLLKI